MAGLAPDFDVVCIGGGFAGLIAAARAAELGARVAVLERGTDERYACNSRWSGGIFHVSYHDVKLPAAALQQAIADATRGSADAAQVAAIAGTSGRVVDWLKAQGARFIRGSAVSWHGWVMAPPRPLSAGLDWAGRGPDVLLRQLAGRITERGGRLLLGHRGVELRMRDGCCTGVFAARAEGTVEIEAPAVVIADGGFQGNAALFRAHIGPHPDAVRQRGAGTGTGDGLAMAMAAGAAVSRLDRFYGHVLSGDALTNDKLWPYPQLDAVAAAGIVVDRGGRRFLDEARGGICTANHLAGLADPLCGTVILDAGIWERAGREAQIPPNPLLERAGGTVHRGGTVAELATAAGLPRAELEASVATYNQAVAAGAAGGLAPPRTGASPPAQIREAPFMAIPICAGITHTMGGIVVDGDGRALRADGSAIAGLYAAGTTTGGLEGGDAVGYVGGLIKAAVFGLRAGEHAAGFVAAQTHAG